MLTRAARIAAVGLALATSSLSGQSDVPDPLAFLEPLIGTWTGAPEWIAQNPGMEPMIPIAFRWGPSRRSILEQSGLPVGGRLFTVGLIAWDPVDQRVELTSSQGGDNLLFTGYYALTGDGDIQRTYDVRYPDGSIVRFRETFFFDGPDALDWLTEWEQGGRWVPRRGNGDPEFRAVRLRVDPAETRTALTPWEGRWSGADGSRIEVGRTAGGSGLELSLSDPTGAGLEGLIYRNPHTGTLQATLIADDGAVVNGDLEFASPSSLGWTFEEFEPDGTIVQRSEEWRLDGRCIVRMAVGPRGPRPEQRLCRAGFPGS